MVTYRRYLLARGGKNSNNISIKYRGIHPTFLGNIDLLVCGNSDPGTSGVLSPFSNIDGFYFNNSEEPEDFAFAFKQDLRKIMAEKDVTYIEIEADNKEDYYNILDYLAKFNKEAITVYAESRNTQKIIIEETEDFSVETLKESNAKEETLV